MREGYTRSRARLGNYHSGSDDRGYSSPPRRGGNSAVKFAAVSVVAVVIVVLIIAFRGPILGVFGLGGEAAPTPTPSTMLEASPTPEPTPSPTPEPTESVEPTESASADATETATASPSPTPAQATDITISAVGNMIMDAKELNAAKDSSSGNYDFSSMFAAVKDQLVNTDLTLGTLDSAVAGKDAGYTTGTLKYNTPESILTTLKDIGFDVLSTANMHIFDKGFDGVTNTSHNITNAGMVPVGTYGSKAEYHAAPAMVAVNGTQIAILAYSNQGKYENLLTAAQDGFVIKRIDVNTIKTDVDAAKAAGAQIIIVMMDWVNDADKTPSSTMQDQAKKIIGYGANLIIGSNPEAVEKIEKIDVTNVDGTHNSGIVAYSLGNFTAKGTTGKDSGMILNVTFEKDPTSGAFAIKDSTYIPTYISYDSKSGYLVMPVNKYLDSQDLLKQLSTAAKNRLQAIWTEITTLVGSTDSKPVARNTGN